MAAREESGEPGQFKQAGLACRVAGPMTPSLSAATEEKKSTRPDFRATMAGMTL